MRYSTLLPVFALSFLVAACNGATSPMSASPMSPSTVPAATPGVSLAGSWSGSFADSSGSAAMSWQAVETGTQLHGDMDWTDGGHGMHGTGTFAAVVDHDRLEFTATVPTGGFGHMTGCTLSITGSGQFDPSWQTCTGTYSGTNSCTGAMTNGQFTLQHR